MDLDLSRYIRDRFDIEEIDIRTYSPLTLAYIGDGIFDLVIRTLVVSKGNTKANVLHARTSHIVRAESQARLLEAVEGMLSDEELAVYRRGRNAKSATTAKNASVREYRIATGYEALLGFLYLEGRMERLTDIVEEGLKQVFGDAIIEMEGSSAEEDEGKGADYA